MQDLDVIIIQTSSGAYTALSKRAIVDEFDWPSAIATFTV